MIRSILLILAVIAVLQANAGNRIKYYFNQPVDNSVAKGVNAVYLNKCMGDTIVAYINRAKYTLDIAVYNYTSTFPAISVAVNAAHNRGVVVRWIYDVAQSNTGLPSLSAGFSKLASPSSSDYTIMHNKFMVIDANSTNPSDAILWTSSSNWNSQQFNYDHNNAVVIQDQAIAKAYLAQFNMMWGGAGAAPNMSASKFGQYKTDLGQHNFTVDGTQVELYFSPADGTNSHIQSTISSADKDMYFGMYTFTHTSNASMLIAKHNSGVYVAGIDDASSNSSSPYSMLTAGLGGNFKVFNGSGFDIYHNKFLIVDPSDKCSDPTVLTGSHNWSISADTKNDENTLIIHDDTAANIYYQSFRANFAAMGGTLNTIAGCGTSVLPVADNEKYLSVYPDPSTGNVNISYELPNAEKANIAIFNVLGQKIWSISKDNVQPGINVEHISIDTDGMYLIELISNDQRVVKKIFIAK